MTPPHRLAQHYPGESSDDSLPLYGPPGGRPFPSFESWLSFRKRPRRVALLFFIVAVISLTLLVRHPSTRTAGVQTCKISPGSQSPCVSELPSDFPPPETVTVTLPPETVTVAVEPQVEPVIFALVLYFESSAKEGAVLIKSAIMYSSRPLQFHIVCDEAAQVYLETRLRLLTHPLNPISVRFYRLSFQSMLDRIAREGAIFTEHAAGTPGLMKLFLHEILPDDVGKVIYVDTDAFFLTDPALLWEEFVHWESAVSISMPYHPDQNTKEWHYASRICSCIMLLHLGKLRAARLMDSNIYRADQSGVFPPALSPPSFEAMYGPPGPEGHYVDAILGDQGYWWAIVSDHPELFAPLSYDWEVSSCLLDMYNTGLGHDGISEQDESKAMVHLWDTPYDGQVVRPKLLHFNCLHHTDVYYTWAGWSDPENSLTKRWKPAVDYHVGFKWLWLNRGSSNSTVDIETLDDPPFADQRFVAEH